MDTLLFLILVLGPYLLIGVFARIFLPRVRPNPLALLGALLMIIATSQLPNFPNVFQFSEVRKELIEGPLAETSLFILFVITSVYISILTIIAIPFLISRGGIEIVDKIKKRKLQPTA